MSCALLSVLPACCGSAVLLGISQAFELLHCVSAVLLWVSRGVGNGPACCRSAALPGYDVASRAYYGSVAGLLGLVLPSRPTLDRRPGQ